MSPLPRANPLIDGLFLGRLAPLSRVDTLTAISGDPRRPRGGRRPPGGLRLPNGLVRAGFVPAVGVTSSCSLGGQIAGQPLELRVGRVALEPTQYTRERLIRSEPPVSEATDNEQRDRERAAFRRHPRQLADFSSVDAFAHGLGAGFDLIAIGDCSTTAGDRVSRDTHTLGLLGERPLDVTRGHALRRELERPILECFGRKLTRPGLGDSRQHTVGDVGGQNLTEAR